MKSHLLFKVLFFIPVLLFVGGCQSPTYRISSTPSEAEVEMTYKNGLKKSLGKTPVSTTAIEANPTREAAYISIRKSGYEHQSIFVPPAFYDKSVDINVMMNTDLRSQDSKKIESSMNQIASSVADVQKDIQKKDFLAAEQKLARLLTDYPNISALYSLMGNVQYLERKLDSALVYYKKALDLEPSSVELSRIIEKIQGLKPGGTQ